MVKKGYDKRYTFGELAALQMTSNIREKEKSKEFINIDFLRFYNIIPAEQQTALSAALRCKLASEKYAEAALLYAQSEQFRKKADALFREAQGLERSL